MPEDYLLRLARQMGQMLATLIGHREKGRQDEAEQEIEKICLESVGLSWKTVRQSSPEALMEQLQSAGALRHFRAVLLAELLIQDAELRDLEGQISGAIRSRLQAFCLISDVLDMLSNEDLEVYRPKLDELARQLEPASGHPYLQEKLRAYKQPARAPEA